MLGAARGLVCLLVVYCVSGHPADDHERHPALPGRESSNGQCTDLQSCRHAIKEAMAEAAAAKAELRTYKGKIGDIVYDLKETAGQCQAQLLKSRQTWLGETASAGFGNTMTQSAIPLSPSGFKLKVDDGCKYLPVYRISCLRASHLACLTPS